MSLRSFLRASRFAGVVTLVVCCGEPTSRVPPEAEPARFNPAPEPNYPPTAVPLPPPPVPLPPPEARTSRTVEITGAIPTLPFRLDDGTNLPEIGTPEREIIERWAALEGHPLAAAADVTFDAHVAELALLGAQRIFEISGAHLVRPHIPHGLVHFVERDGRIGPVLRVALGDTRPPTFDPTQPSPGPRPWLLAAEAARHAAQHSATIR